MVIVIDGNKLVSIASIHEQLKEKFKLPDYYGNNLDALWDCLSGFIELPVTLIWKNVDIVESDIREYILLLYSVFEMADNEIDGFDFVAINRINIEI